MIVEGLSLANQRKPESKAKAIEKYEEATRLYRLMEDQKRKAAGIQQIGQLYQSIRKDADALKFFEEAAQIFDDAGLKRDAALVLLDAGNSTQGYGEALPYYQKKQLSYYARQPALAFI